MLYRSGIQRKQSRISNDAVDRQSRWRLTEEYRVKSPPQSGRGFLDEFNKRWYFKILYVPIMLAPRLATPLAYSNFFNNTISLSNYDLVSNLLELRRSGGHVRMMELNVRPEIVEEIFKEKVEG